MVPYYYSIATEQIYSDFQMQTLFGINVTTTDITVLNQNGFYPVVFTEPSFDTALYSPNASYVIAGTDAIQTWTAAPLPLSTAKENASQEAKTSSNTQASDLVTASGVNLDIWTGAASQLEVDRPPLYNTLLGEMATIGDNLVVTLAAIDAATTVDEINNIVNPPTGILSTGRGGDGDGPLDLNNSFYTEFNSVSLTEADTELYVPGTSTVITYGAVVPNGFTSNGDCFVLGDYQVQIREVATGMVISEFECPLAVAANVDVPF